MNLSIVENRTERIIECHRGIAGSMKQALDYALEAGELLSVQKEALKHGDLLPWIKAFMPFSERTDYNYIKLHEHHDKNCNSCKFAGGIPAD